MPINVSNEHWYLAVVKIGEHNVELNILNNLDMRNENAEEKLRNIARKYCQRMIAQRNRAYAVVKVNTPTKIHFSNKYVVTDTKQKISRRLNFTPTQAKSKVEETGHDEIINLNGHKHAEEMDKLEHRTPNRTSHMQSIKEGTSQNIQSSQNREELLHRTRQSKNNISHCVAKNSSKYEDKSDMDDTEEVIYSDGEPFEGYQYPNNTWDSDDSLYEEDYSTKTGWI